MNRDINPCRIYIKFIRAMAFQYCDSNFDNPLYPNQLFLILRLLSDVFKIKFKLLRITFKKQTKIYDLAPVDRLGSFFFAIVCNLHNL